MLKIRLTRSGTKKRPYYRIVVADARAPRDGRFIEKVGTYNPMLPKTDENRVRLLDERIKYWLGQGAQPTDRVAIFLGKAGIIEKPVFNNPEKAKPSEKTQERLKEREEKLKAAEEAANAPAEEAPAEEAVAEAAAEEAPAEEAAAEAPAEEAAAEDAPAEEEKKEDA
tara:strand:+ start:198 stop:701 length:504 start_codon:yes stop_codon:yes gene_type:complete